MDVKYNYQNHNFPINNAIITDMDNNITEIGLTATNKIYIKEGCPHVFIRNFRKNEIPELIKILENLYEQMY